MTADEQRTDQPDVARRDAEIGRDGAPARCPSLSASVNRASMPGKSRHNNPITAAATTARNATNAANGT